MMCWIWSKILHACRSKDVIKIIENWNDHSNGGWNMGQYSAARMCWCNEINPWPIFFTQSHSNHIADPLSNILRMSGYCLSLTVSVSGEPDPRLVTGCLSPRGSLHLSAPWVVYRTPAYSSPHPLHQNLLPLHCHRFLPFWLFLQQWINVCEQSDIIKCA